jgi:hypothetical protein
VQIGLAAQAAVDLSGWKKAHLLGSVMRRHVFVAWSITLGLVWLFANWPQNFGVGSFLCKAGFPLVFAFWAGGELEWFKVSSLVIDCAVGLAFVFGLAWLCARSRRSSGQRN